MTIEKTGIWLKLAITLTFVSGALIFMYPFVANIINTQVDKYRIEEMEKQTALNQENQLAKKKAREEELEKNPHLGMKLEDELFDEVETSSRLSASEIKEHLIGSISIPKINSELPIFDTTNSSFLQEGITLLPGASYPTGGEGTHSVLTGHTGLPNKKLLTDLKDVVEGDIFYIKVLGETIAYKVDQIKIVLPDELEDLEVEEGKDYLTLVTCTPYMINTHRLLVRGERTEINYQAVEKVKKEIDRKNKMSLVFYGLIILALIGLVIYVGYRQFIHYQILKRHYRLSFTLLNTNEPVGKMAFTLVDKSKRHPIMKSGKEVTVVSNNQGKISLPRLRGGRYWLVLQGETDKPLSIKCWIKNYNSRKFEVQLAKNTSDEWDIKFQKRKK